MQTMCPRCLTADATIRVNLADGETLTCNDCDEEYTLAEVESLVESWSKLLPWLRQHPTRPPQCAAAKVA